MVRKRLYTIISYIVNKKNKKKKRKEKKKKTSYHGVATIAQALELINKDKP